MTNTEELEFARKIRHALDARCAVLPPSTQQRLASARNVALSHYKSEARTNPVLAIAGPSLRQPRRWHLRLGMAAPLVAGLALVIGLYQFEQQSHQDQVADLDAAVMLDDLPLAAYTDHGFNSFLMKRGD